MSAKYSSLRPRLPAFSWKKTTRRRSLSISPRSSAFLGSFYAINHPPSVWLSDVYTFTGLKLRLRSLGERYPLGFCFAYRIGEPGWYNILSCRKNKNAEVATIAIPVINAHCKANFPQEPLLSDGLFSITSAILIIYSFNCFKFIPFKFKFPKNEIS